MKMEKKQCSTRKILIFVGGTALTIAGFLVIPKMLEKYSNKMYKSSLKKEKIDFDSMGPEIVPHDNKEGEKTNDFRHR